MLSADLQRDLQLDALIEHLWTTHYPDIPCSVSALTGDVGQAHHAVVPDFRLTDHHPAPEPLHDALLAIPVLATQEHLQAMGYSQDPAIPAVLNDAEPRFYMFKYNLWSNLYWCWYPLVVCLQWLVFFLTHGFFQGLYFFGLRLSTMGFLAATMRYGIFGIGLWIINTLTSWHEMHRAFDRRIALHTTIQTVRRKWTACRRFVQAYHQRTQRGAVWLARLDSWTPPDILDRLDPHPPATLPHHLWLSTWCGRQDPWLCGVHWLHTLHRDGVFPLLPELETLVRVEAWWQIWNSLHDSGQCCDVSRGHPATPRETIFANVYLPGRIAMQPYTLTLTPGLTFLTGRNGSGKTTLLRTIGLNVVFARQYGLAFAESMQLGDVDEVTTCIQLPAFSDRDSLFTAEARRCREIMTSTEPCVQPLILMDELFSSTNPIDAIHSGIAYLRVLREQQPNAIVWISTHLLPLVEQMASESAQHAMCRYQLCVDQVERGHGQLPVFRNLAFPPRFFDLSRQLYRAAGIEIDDADSIENHDQTSPPNPVS